ncbi:MAG: hypothetical protein J5905_01075 [Prevotella sp.]|nr:hypothetical protein [Prevotella sp.]
MNFKEFAVEHGLNIWDWIAVSVSAGSMLIAVISLLVAYFTLRSQKQTERNTMPIINKDVQEFLLQELIYKLLDGQIRIGALWYLLYDKKFIYYPSEQILENFKVSTDTIHTELFYNNKSLYRCVQGLLNMTIEYNINISTLNDHLSNKMIDKDFLYREFKVILDQNERLADTWRKVMTCVYHYDDKKISSVFQWIVENTQNPPANYKKACFNEEDEIYLDFMTNKETKEKILYYMDSRAVGFINEYNNFLIKK